MPLDVIGAGFGRNGTESLKLALEILGYGPCYHMYEVIGDPARVDLWRGAATAGTIPDWDHVFDGFRATVDWPGAYYWRELASHFPDAKIILPVRSSESWFASMETTILKVIRESEGEETLGRSLIAKRVFGGNVDDRDHIIATYEQNTRDVQAAFSDDRLLTYELGSGWAPICEFLGCDVPDMPYPSGNQIDYFHAKLEALRGERRKKRGQS